MAQKQQKQMVREFAKRRGLKFQKDPLYCDDHFYTTNKSCISVSFNGVQFFYFDDYFGNGFCAGNGQISGYSFDSLFQTMKGYMNGVIAKNILVEMCE